MIVKTTERSLDGHFLACVIHEYASGERQLDAVYLGPEGARTVVLTRRFASHEELYAAYVDGHLTSELSKEARKQIPAVEEREKQNIAATRPLAFEGLDFSCDNCGAQPGEPCSSSSHCANTREETCLDFLVWLGEQIRTGPKKLTKKLIVEIAERQGYCSATNLYSRGTGVVLTQWKSGNCWRLYIGGKLDPTKSVWMTSGTDLSDPDCGPFKDVQSVALAVRAVSRGALP
jgi:hypothetical protein